MSKRKSIGRRRDVLPELPDGWRQERLYDVAELRTSNVDKKSEDGETAVRLCNYVDVYYHDRITDDLNFMEATATEAQVDRFGLKVGDVVITKDSESPDDIGVPALIAESIPGLVCGYHLTILRPMDTQVVGEYLLHALKSVLSAHQFYLAANGVTRFGLTYQGTKNIRIALPSLPEQRRIAAFLDWKTGQIDALIARKRELIEKLKEKRLAVITQAVARGLNPDAPLRDSGVPWLGDVPEHWEVLSLRYCFDVLNNRRIPISGEDRANMTREYPYYGASGIIDYVDDYIFDEPLILIAEDGANLLSRSTALAFEARGKYWVNNHAHILRPILGPFAYWSNLLCVVQYDPWVTGAAQPKLTKDNLGSIPLPCPPVQEQVKIAKFIESQVEGVDALVERVTHAITRLTEYRTALVTAATTGKIDVRNITVPTQPLSPP